MAPAKGARRWLAAAALWRVAADAASDVAAAARSPARPAAPRRNLLHLEDAATPVEDPPADDQPARFLEVSYSLESMQPLVTVDVGGQPIKLVFDASSGNTIVFVREFNACLPAGFRPCYSFEAASETLRVCADNNDDRVTCNSRTETVYPCEQYLASLRDANASGDELMIDGIEYDQRGVEAKDSVSIRLQGREGRTVSWSAAPVRLLIAPMKVPEKLNLSLPLFQEMSGILGASGPSLSCRNGTVWSMLLGEERVARFVLDFSAPSNATVRDARPSRVVLNDVDPKYAEDIVWSERKQTGDKINDGMHEFLMYHISLCGVDLLYNVSSSWLAVIDTSGPCLTLPGALFDRVMAHAPVECPFSPGASSMGRLCSPKRGDGISKLPSISFQMRDITDKPARRLQLPLERLVYRNGSGVELLCIARDDIGSKSATADMMYSHISIGSLAVASFYLVVDLEHHKVGLASKGDPAVEASEASCAVAPDCVGMQLFYPPLNLCEDPDCSAYMFMSLDERTRVCKWMRSVPVMFALVLVGLVVLDLLSHRLYKQAVERASESSR